MNYGKQRKQVMVFKHLATLYKNNRNNAKRWLGIFLFDRKPKSSTVSLTDPKHIVFLRSDGKWGDSIISSCVFTSLKTAVPNAKITVLTTKIMAEYFRDYLNIEHTVTMPDKPSYKYYKTLAKELGTVDLLIIFSKYVKMKEMYLLNQVQASIVAGLDDRLQLINLKLGEKTQDMHFADKYAYLLERLQIPATTGQYIVPLNKQKLAAVDQFLKSKKVYPLLALNPYGSGKGRKINKQNIIRLIGEILTVSPAINIVLLSTPESLSEVESICDEIKQENVFLYPDCQSIYDAVALVYYAKWVISVDTAIVHIASGLHKPLLALYIPNPKEYPEWHPNSPLAITHFANKATPANINALDWEQLKVDLSKLLLSKSD